MITVPPPHPYARMCLWRQMHTKKGRHNAVVCGVAFSRSTCFFKIWTIIPRCAKVNKIVHNCAFLYIIVHNCAPHTRSFACEKNPSFELITLGLLAKKKNITTVLKKRNLVSILLFCLSRFGVSQKPFHFVGALFRHYDHFPLRFLPKFHGLIHLSILIFLALH